MEKMIAQISDSETNKMEDFKYIENLTYFFFS